MILRLICLGWNTNTETHFNPEQDAASPGDDVLLHESTDTLEEICSLTVSFWKPMLSKKGFVEEGKTDFQRLQRKIEQVPLHLSNL